jgi:hypothetical protein
MEWDKLWTINKKIIDPVCPRHTAIVTEGNVLLTLSNGPQEPLVKVSVCSPCTVYPVGAVSILLAYSNSQGSFKPT